MAYDGYIPEQQFYKGFDAIPSRIAYSFTIPWRQDIYSAWPPQDNLVFGPLTNNAPIDVISWIAGPGEIKITGMEIWQQCMTLFMRHV